MKPFLAQGIYLSSNFLNDWEMDWKILGENKKHRSLPRAKHVERYIKFLGIGMT